MKKLLKIACFSLTIAILLSASAFLSSPALCGGGEEDSYSNQADALNSLGIFFGTEKGYELERAPDRTEALVMLLRLLGLADEAVSYTGSHPFGDVPNWASKYVAYAYNKRLTLGTSQDTFGSSDPCNEKMYLTFVLRALGYDDSNGDFTYADSVGFAISSDLVEEFYEWYFGEYDFLRDDMVYVSYNALFTELNGAGTILLEKLLAENAVPKEAGQRYLDLYKADTVIKNAFAKTVESKYIEKGETIATDLISSGTQLVLESSVSDVKVSFVSSGDIKISEICSLYSAGSLAYKYEFYVKDSFYYSKHESFKNPEDNGTFKHEIEPYDLGYYVEGYTVLTTIDYYSYDKVSVAKSGENTVIKMDYTSQNAAEEAQYNIFAYDDDTDYGTAATVRDYSITYVISPEEYLISTYENLEFSYVRDNGETATFTHTVTTTYKNIGNPVTVTFPDDLDSYEVAEE